MSTQLKLRRGTTAQHSTFTGAEGEVTVDTTKDTLVVHDGTTVGGIPLARADGNVASATTATTATALATGRTIALTGDVSYTSPSFNGSANVTAAATLTASGVTAGTYGSASAIPAITVDAKGRVTSATTSAVASSAPTTAQVLAAKAGASFNAVGTYAYAGINVPSGGAVSAGSNYSAGTGNYQVQAFVIGTGAGANILSGTWKLMNSGITSYPYSGFAGSMMLRVA